MAMLARFTPSAAGAETRAATAAAAAGGGGPPAAAAATTTAAPAAAASMCSKCGEVAAAACVTVRCQPLCRHCLLTTTQARLKGPLIASPAVGRSVALSLSSSAACVATAALLNKLADFGRRPRFFSSVCAIHVDTSRAGSPPPPPTGAPVPPSPLSAAAAAVVALALQQRLSVVVVPLEAAFADGVGDAAAWSVVAAAADVDVPPTERRAVAAGVPNPDGLATALPADAPSIVAAVASAGATAAARWSGAAWDDARSRMDAAFGGSASNDARAELLAACVAAVAVATAHRCRVAALIRCDTADTAAAAILSAVCTGRGEGIPLLAAPVDTVHVHVDDSAAIAVPNNWYAAPIRPLAAAGAAADGDGVVLVLRPFLEVEAAELDLYCDAAGLPRPPARAVATSTGGIPGSIAAATAALVTGLQAAFANTVHNVVRTSSKLVLPPHAAASGSASAPTLCVLCRALLPADTPAATASAAAAAHEVGIDPTPPRLLHLLCRGCLLSRRAGGGNAVEGLVAGLDRLPAHALAGLAAASIPSPPADGSARRAALRAHLADWLLCDSDDGDGDDSGEAEGGAGKAAAAATAT